MKITGLAILFLGFLAAIHCTTGNGKEKSHVPEKKDTMPLQKAGQPEPDTALYNKKILHMVHYKPAGGWPVKTDYPLPGALLPFNRIVAYYGNLYSAGMGVLGEPPPEKMLDKLKEEVKRWSAADSLTPVLPALHYIAVTAQHSQGKDGKYRLRMPFEQVDKVLELAGQIDALVFLDIQVGHSSLEEEIPLIEKYLRMPGVHLGIDPEYSMKGGQAPGRVIGTFDAADVNYASGFLAGLVRKYDLPPKVLIVHRFTQGMVTNFRSIVTRPEVQIVMHMDGFGPPAKKIDSYKTSIVNQPVEFTGFKLFYKQDTPEPMQPAAVLQLYPRPVYIQYQ